MSRELVRLHCEVPLPHAIEDMKLVATPPEPLKAFLGAMGFKTSSPRSKSPVEITPTDGPAPPPALPFDLDSYELILTRGAAAMVGDRGHHARPGRGRYRDR